MIGARVLATVLLSCAACTADVNVVRLTVPAGAKGLLCEDASGALLAERAAPGTMLTVAVDYLALDGVASARASVLLRFCTDPGCPVVRRDCQSIPVPTPLPPPGEIQQRAVEALAADNPITTDAPDGVVSIRAVLTTQTCVDLEIRPDGSVPPFDRSALVGCLYSAPLQLDLVRGDVDLELDVLGDCGEREVCICANLGLDLTALCPAT